MLTPKRLIQGATLSLTAFNLYTAPLQGAAVIRNVTVANPTAFTRKVTIYLVPRNGTAGSDNIVVDSLVLTAHTSQVIPQALHVLERGDGIWALADLAGAVTLTASGYELT
jgi:hypothetical protein